MRKNGQAALEFMMTYGWAILVVLAAIGALSYFGVLDPSRFTPNTCITSSGFSCDGKPLAGTNDFAITVSNGQGYSVNLSNDKIALSNLQGCAKENISICTRGSICPNDITDGTPTGNNSLIVVDGGSATIFVHDCNFANMNIIKGDVTLTYTNPKSSLPEELKISVVVKPK